MKQRLFALGLALILVLAWAAALSEENTMQKGSMYVNTANGRALRFRTTKSTYGNDNVICEIPYGTKVFVQNWDGTWARITYNGRDGYVVQKHLTIARPKPFAEVEAEREAEDAARLAALEAEAEAKELQKKEENAERLRLAELNKANAKLDKSKIKVVPEYDATVVIGVVDMTTNLYDESKLTANVLARYSDGTRLVVQAENRDWALVYDGTEDLHGYILKEDIIPDVEEEILLED